MLDMIQLHVYQGLDIKLSHWYHGKALEIPYPCILSMLKCDKDNFSFFEGKVSLTEQYLRIRNLGESGEVAGSREELVSGP